MCESEMARAPIFAHVVTYRNDSAVGAGASTLGNQICKL